MKHIFGEPGIFHPLNLHEYHLFFQHSILHSFHLPSLHFYPRQILLQSQFHHFLPSIRLFLHFFSVYSAKSSNSTLNAFFISDCTTRTHSNHLTASFLELEKRSLAKFTTLFIKKNNKKSAVSACLNWGIPTLKSNLF
jgi:hypothetical protein